MIQNDILGKILPNSLRRREESKFKRTLYVLLSGKHIGLQYSEFQDMPIYILKILLDEYAAELKAQAKANKKK